jgi:fused signal recognition particle receptor
MLLPCALPQPWLGFGGRRPEEPPSPLLKPEPLLDPELALEPPPVVDPELPLEPPPMLERVVVDAPPPELVEVSELPFDGPEDEPTDELLDEPLPLTPVELEDDPQATAVTMQTCSAARD